MFFLSLGLFERRIQNKGWGISPCSSWRTKYKFIYLFIIIIIIIIIFRIRGPTSLRFFFIIVSINRNLYNIIILQFNIYTRCSLSIPLPFFSLLSISLFLFNNSRHIFLHYSFFYFSFLKVKSRDFINIKTPNRTTHRDDSIMKKNRIFIHPNVLHILLDSSLCQKMNRHICFSPNLQHLSGFETI